MESKYITTADYNKFTKNIVHNSIKIKNLVDKFAIFGLASNAELNLKVATLATKAELKAEKNKIEKLEAFNISYFLGKSHFEEHGTKNYLVFQSLYRYFKKIISVGSGDDIYFWKSRGLSDESINSPITSDDIITPQVRLLWYNNKSNI